MALPKQVQDALDAADATLNQISAPPGIDPDQGGAADDPGDSPTSLDAEPPQQAEPVPPQAPTKPTEDWERKYKSLQGMFNSQVPLLQGRVKDLELDLRTAIERLDKASEVKEQVPANAPAMDSKDVNAFGEDLVSMVQRVAQSVIGQASRAFEAKATAIAAEITALKTQLEGTNQTVAVTAEQGFFNRVNELVPNWEKTNDQPAFHAWLAESDPVYGVPRQNALTHARNSLDSDRVAAVFLAFTGPPKALAAPAGNPLEQQVSPRSAGSPPPPTQKSAQIISSADVTQFYDDVRRGVYRGKAEEAARIESAINTALAEGRVR